MTQRENWYEDGIMKRVGVRLSGLKGTWYLIDEYHDGHGNTYYLWDSEERGEYIGDVLTDETLTVIDYCCESGMRTALFENGILIDETEQEDEAMMDEFEDELLLAGLDY